MTEKIKDTPKTQEVSVDIVPSVEAPMYTQEEYNRQFDEGKSAADKGTAKSLETQRQKLLAEMDARPSRENYDKLGNMLLDRLADSQARQLYDPRVPDLQKRVASYEEADANRQRRAAMGDFQQRFSEFQKTQQPKGLSNSLAGQEFARQSDGQQELESRAATIRELYEHLRQGGDMPSKDEFRGMITDERGFILSRREIHRNAQAHFARKQTIKQAQESEREVFSLVEEGHLTKAEARQLCVDEETGRLLPAEVQRKNVEGHFAKQETARRRERAWEGTNSFGSHAMTGVMPEAIDSYEKQYAALRRRARQGEDCGLEFLKLKSRFGRK